MEPPSPGDWVIVVASQASESVAEERLPRFRDQLGDLNLPVTIVAGTSGETTRYRIGVGAFESQSDAQSAIERHSTVLPDGAWPLRVKSTP